VNLPQHSHSMTPLYTACYMGRREVVRVLLEDGRVNVNAAEASGATPLYAACWRGDLEIVLLLLSDTTIDVAQEKTHNNVSPLYISCFKGRTGIVRKLLGEPGIRLNPRTRDDGWTPFAAACAQGKLAIVEEMMTREGVEINGVDHQGNTPFALACKMGQQRVVRFLARQPAILVNHPNNEGETPFLLACKAMKVKVVKDMLLELPGVDLDRPDAAGVSPLYFAAGKSLELTRLLLACDREIDTRRSPGTRLTPAGRAQSLGHLPTFELIERYELNWQETALGLQKELGIDREFFFFFCCGHSFVFFSFLLNISSWNLTRRALRERRRCVCPRSVLL